MSDVLLLKHSQIFNQRMTFLRASRLSFAPFFGSPDSQASKIIIELSEDYITAGQVISGSIYIDLKTKLTACDLILTSTGLEELRIYSNFRLSSEKSSKVYSFSVTLRYWPELQPNVYRIPFMLKIPQHCPATFYYSDQDLERNYIKASISYLLTCTINSKETEITQNKILIVKSAGSLKSCPEEVEKVGQIRSCLCWTLGQSIFYIQPENREHGKVNGSFVYRLLSNNSECSKAIVSVCSQIVRVLRCITVRQEFKVKTILSKIHRTINIPARSGIFDSPDFSFNHDLKMGSDDFNTSSTEGKVVKCQFFLEIFVYYSGKLTSRPCILLHELFVNPDLGPKDTHDLPLRSVDEPMINLFIED